MKVFITWDEETHVVRDATLYDLQRVETIQDEVLVSVRPEEIGYELLPLPMNGHRITRLAATLQTQWRYAGEEIPAQLMLLPDHPFFINRLQTTVEGKS